MDTEARTEWLTAHEEIRQLVARYAIYLDARDIDSLVQLYVPDVRISTKLSGRDVLRGLLETSLRDVGLTILHMGTHTIDVSKDDPETATGIAYCRAEIQDGGPDRDRWIVQAIQYHDTYRRLDGRWYFGANRKHELVYGAEMGESPLGMAPADWPANQTGQGSMPYSLDTWQRFWANPG